MKKIIGIIGGMGPLATVDLMKKIILYTSAKQDQDHIHVIADSYPQIPDRTAAIFGKGSDPTPFLVESAQRLEQAGADFLIIACNTAHYYYHAIQESVNIPIIHMPRETASFLQENDVEKVGLLATDGTLTTKLYQDCCLIKDVQVIVPDEDMQKEVMEGIYSIKGNDLDKGYSRLSKVANHLKVRGAEMLIAGCTEVPLVLQSSENRIIIDSTDILAQAAVKKAKEAKLETASV